MAGYFNPEALDDPEVMSVLNNDEHRAWIVLCVESHPRCGIFMLNSRLWSSRCRTPLRALSGCLKTYEKLGWIKRDGDYIWIVNYTRHQSKQEQWLARAREEAEALVGTTQLAQEWLDYYAGIKPKSALKSGLKSGSSDRQTEEQTDRRQTGAPQSTAVDAPPPDTTPSELAILTELKSIATHPFDWKQDLQYIRTLTLDFPTLDLLAVVKSLHAWLDDHKGKKSGRLRLRNSCELALKWGKNLKAGSTPFIPDTEYEDTGEIAD